MSQRNNLKFSVMSKSKLGQAPGMLTNIRLKTDDKALDGEVSAEIALSRWLKRQEHRQVRQDNFFKEGKLVVSPEKPGQGRRRDQDPKQEEDARRRELERDNEIDQFLDMWVSQKVETL